MPVDPQYTLGIPIRLTVSPAFLRPANRLHLKLPTVFTARKKKPSRLSQKSGQSIAHLQFGCGTHRSKLGAAPRELTDSVDCIVSPPVRCALRYRRPCFPDACVLLCAVLRCVALREKADRGCDSAILLSLSRLPCMIDPPRDSTQTTPFSGSCHHRILPSISLD